MSQTNLEAVQQRACSKEESLLSRSSTTNVESPAPNHAAPKGIVASDGQLLSLECIGQGLHQWAQTLFPICRSITGPGVRETLKFAQSLLPDLKIHAVATGTPAFDWEVPQEWRVDEAYIADEQGKRLIDFENHNLHVLGYSTAINRLMDFAELDQHLHSLPEQPTAIPYVTSYYTPRWGFCLSHEQRQQLDTNARYQVVINSQHYDGELNYAEFLLPGQSKEEVLISSYVCHPSMANNELSGPVVLMGIAQWLSALPVEQRHYSYRFVLLPETIGSITYISRHLHELKSRVKAGFNLTCIGDERGISMLHSRLANSLADKVAGSVLDRFYPHAIRYSYLDRGSDERQYCAPGVDLPLVSLMRSKYAEYPEYHTSLDDLNLVSPEGLAGGFEWVQRCIQTLEANRCYRLKVLCEPRLGPRGLYPTLSKKGVRKQVGDMMNIIAYTDGELDVLDVCQKLSLDFATVADIYRKLLDAEVVEKVR